MQLDVYLDHFFNFKGMPRKLNLRLESALQL